MKYITVRSDGGIMELWSTETNPNQIPGERDIPLLIADEETEDMLCVPVTVDGIPFYRYDAEDDQIVTRSTQEIQAERDQANNDRDEMLVEHELRLTMMELGV